MVVAAVSTPINPKPTTAAARSRTPSNPNRPPLLPSEPDNNNKINNNNARRPKSREVTSRYLSSSSSSSSTSSSSSSNLSNSKRFVSPTVPRTGMNTPSSAAAPVKRSQSAERRRVPATPKGGELSTAQKMLVTSARSLSVSFQGESFSLQVSKARPKTPAPSPISSVRKPTPERRKPASSGDSSKLIEQQRWPGRLRDVNSLSRSVDITEERKKLSGSNGNYSNSNVVRALHNSMVDARASFDGRLTRSNSGGITLPKGNEATIIDSNCGVGSIVRSDFVGSSDSESVSSGSTASGGMQESRPKGVVVPARFWQETGSRSRRITEPGSPLSRNTNGLRTPGLTPKVNASAIKKRGSDSPVASPKGFMGTRGQVSPARGAIWPASPSKLASSVVPSPMRGLSPSRVRNAMGASFGDGNSLSSTPSILSFAAEVRRGKMGENRVVDAHMLRLLYNRLLQWQFVNARSDAALSIQKLNAETSIYNAWVSTLKLRESVRAKKAELQLERQDLKLASILREQVIYLENWASLDREYSSSLSGATEALRASTLRLPVIGGARADIQKLKNAISSAVDVMQAMASSVCVLLSKVGNVNGFVGELTNVVAQERALLDQCRDLLSNTASKQITEASLRTHILQLDCPPGSFTSTFTTKL